MPEVTYPGELNELDFVEAYARSALRKPEMAADAALRSLVFAEAGDRAILVGLIAQELGEVSRGSAHWQALFMVGIVLFVISLAVNACARAVVRRFELPKA